MDDQAKQGLIYAMRLLSISKKSEKRIREKLKEKGYSQNSIEEVTGELKTKGILDDLKFAKEKVYWAHHGNPVGKRRLKFELKKHGVKDSQITEALEDIDPASERDTAFSLAKTQAEKLKALSPIQRKKRLYDFLARRGFDYEICREIVTSLDKRIENN